MTTLKEIFERMPATFQKTAAAGVDAVVQFDVTGEGGGQYYAAIKDGALDVVEGAHGTPNLTITVSAQDYIAISDGKLNEQLAFMTGRLRAKGDTLLAMKLPAIFKR